MRRLTTLAALALAFLLAGASLAFAAPADLTAGYKSVSASSQLNGTNSYLKALNDLTGSGNRWMPAASDVSPWIQWAPADGLSGYSLTNYRVAMSSGTSGRLVHLYGRTTYGTGSWVLLGTRTTSGVSQFIDWNFSGYNAWKEYRMEFPNYNGYLLLDEIYATGDIVSAPSTIGSLEATEGVDGELVLSLPYVDANDNSTAQFWLRPLGTVSWTTTTTAYGVMGGLASASFDVPEGVYEIYYGYLDPDGITSWSNPGWGTTLLPGSGLWMSYTSFNLYYDYSTDTLGTDYDPDPVEPTSTVPPGRPPISVMPSDTVDLDLPDLDDLVETYPGVAEWLPSWARDFLNDAILKPLQGMFDPLGPVWYPVRLFGAMY